MQYQGDLFNPGFIFISNRCCSLSAFLPFTKRKVLSGAPVCLITLAKMDFKKQGSRKDELGGGVESCIGKGD